MRQAIPAPPSRTANLNRCPQRQRRRRAYTLLELVLALSLTSLVVGGMLSTIIVVTTAGAEDGPDAAWRQAAAALDRMTPDLPYATAFTLRGERAIEFTVADRTGDTAPETIRYEWSGVKGDPIIRTINGATAETFSGAADFSLQYLVRTETTTAPGPDVESGERLWSRRTGLLSLLSPTTSINSGQAAAQIITPALPADATGWTITRASVVMKSEGDLNDVAAAQIRTLGADGHPSTRIIASAPLYEHLLSTLLAWQSVDFGKAGDFEPDESVALVVARQSGDNCGQIGYDGGSGSGYMISPDGGASQWSEHSGAMMYHEVYGTYKTPGTPVTTERHFLTGIRVTIRSAAQNAGAAVTTFALLDQPELTVQQFADLEAAGIVDARTVPAP